MGQRAVIIEDSMAVRLASKPELAKQFPELAKYAAGLGGGGCRGCKSGAARAKSRAAVNSIKNAVVALPQERQAALKAALNATTITVVYKTAQGVQKTVF